MSLTSTSLIEFCSGLAIVGAVIVVIGVVLEGAELFDKFRDRPKEKKWVANVFGTRRCATLIWLGRRIKSHLFWPFEVLGFAILTIGLVIEIVGSFSAERLQSRENETLESTNLALRAKVVALEWQVMEAKTNIVKNDARNWPISEMTATVSFAVMGTNMDVELTNLPAGRKARMTLWKNEREGFSLDDLEAANSDIFGHIYRPTVGAVDRRIYLVQLRSFNFISAVNGTLGISPPLVKTIDDVHLVHVDLNFLPRDSEFSGAVVDLTINGVSKRFMAPEQNDTNSNMGGWNDFQCWFVATNGVQSSPKQFLYLRN